MKVTAFLTVLGNVDAIPEQHPSYVFIAKQEVLKRAIDNFRQIGAEKIGVVAQDEQTIFESDITINRPWINTRKQDYIELHEIENIMGRDWAYTFALENEHEVQKTDHWRRVVELNPNIALVNYLNKAAPRMGDVFFSAQTVLGSAPLVKELKKRGFDGACVVGQGAYADTPLYFVFSADQVKTKKFNVY